MTVGYPINKNVIDSRAGYLVKTLRDVLSGVNTLKGVLDGLDDATLTSMGYTAPEIAVLKSGITDLYNGGKVLTGQQAQAQANNFFYFADNLTGVE